MSETLRQQRGIWIYQCAKYAEIRVCELDDLVTQEEVPFQRQKNAEKSGNGALRYSAIRHGAIGYGANRHKLVDTV